MRSIVSLLKVGKPGGPIHQQCQGKGTMMITKRGRGIIICVSQDENRFNVIMAKEFHL